LGLDFTGASFSEVFSFVMFTTSASLLTTSVISRIASRKDFFLEILRGFFASESTDPPSFFSLDLVFSRSF
jgi:hypothetical protein